MYETSCVFYIPEPLARGYKTHSSFHKYRSVVYKPEPLAKGYKKHNSFHKCHMKWTFISDSFYHMIVPKNINISWKKCVFLTKFRTKIAQKRCALHNVIMILLMKPLAKKCETSVKSVSNVCLIGKFMKWLYVRASHVINVYTCRSELLIWESGSWIVKTANTVKSFIFCCAQFLRFHEIEYICGDVISWILCGWKSPCLEMVVIFLA